MSRRRKGVLAPTIALAAVAAVAIVFLWWSRHAGDGVDLNRGGPLFGAADSPIDGLYLNRRGRQYQFTRDDAGHWTLSGALTDDLDPQAMTALLRTLDAASGGRVLPGTEPGDRRYEFNGPDALQISIHRENGDAVDLAIGTANPVTGTFFATGAGRRFCFTVGADLREKLAGLPDGVRARTLLPAVESEDIERIEITRGGNMWSLARHNEHWWLLVPEDRPDFGELVRRYQSLYDDRRRQDDQGQWLQASTVAVLQLIHQVSKIVVREMVSPDETEALAAAWGLVPPWRRVTLSGPGVDGGTATGPGSVTIGFGPPLGPDSVPVMRRGNILLTDRGAIEVLEQPVASLLELRIMPVDVMKADRMEVAYEGTLLLRGARTGSSLTEEGREAWLTEVPTADRFDHGEGERHGLVRDVLVNLGRELILDVMAPHPGPDPLLARGRVSLALTFGVGSDERTMRWELGTLPASFFVTGAAPPGTGKAALWSPETGRLVVIRDDILVSVRNIAGLQATASSGRNLP